MTEIKFFKNFYGLDFVCLNLQVQNFVLLNLKKQNGFGFFKYFKQNPEIVQGF